MTKCVLKALKHIALVSNANLFRNVDGLLLKQEKEIPVDWFGKSELCVPYDKQKQVINFFRVWYSAVVACWDMVENWIALNFKSHWKLNWADWHIKFFKLFKVLFQCLLVKLTVSGEKNVI